MVPWDAQVTTECKTDAGQLGDSPSYSPLSSAPSTPRNDSSGPPSLEPDTPSPTALDLDHHSVMRLREERFFHGPPFNLQGHRLNTMPPGASEPDIEPNVSNAWRVWLMGPWPRQQVNALLVCLVGFITDLTLCAGPRCVKRNATAKSPQRSGSSDRRRHLIAAPLPAAATSPAHLILSP